MSGPSNNPAEEFLDRSALTELQTRKLRAMLAEILPRNQFYALKLQQAGPVQLLDDLRRLPFTTKAELASDQDAHPPYGTNLTYPLANYSRLHQTSGTTTGRPLRWLDTPASWEWCLKLWGMVFNGVGLRQDDRLFFPFSFGPFIGFWMAFESAARRGNLCIPAGGLSTSARLRFMLENAATVVCCTPTYALRMAEVAAEEKINLAASSVRALVLAGEPGGSIPAVRERIEKAWGARVFDHTGMTEIAALGFECVEAPGGVHLMESEFIAEVIDPSSGDVLPAGREGELVITTLGRWGSPVIRYRTGDLVKLGTERCACGRHFARMMGGILGRVDDVLYVRGNKVLPSGLEALVRGFNDVAEFRVEVVESSSLNAIRIQIEPTPAAAARANLLAQQIARAVQDQFLFRPEVVAVAAGSLPRFELKAQRFVRQTGGGR